MTGRSDNELRELADRFYDAEEMARCLDDFEQAEKVLANKPAPAPSASLLATIKANVRSALARRRRNRVIRRVGTGAASVAAAVAFVAAVHLGLFDTAPLTESGVVRASIIPAALWEGGDITTVDPSLAYFAAEIEDIESELAALQSGEDESAGDIAVTELEMEFIEIEGAFWKG